MATSLPIVRIQKISRSRPRFSPPIRCEVKFAKDLKDVFDTYKAISDHFDKKTWVPIQTFIKTNWSAVRQNVNTNWKSIEKTVVDSNWSGYAVVFKQVIEVVSAMCGDWGVNKYTILPNVLVPCAIFFAVYMIGEAVVRKLKCVAESNKDIGVFMYIGFHVVKKNKGWLTMKKGNDEELVKMAKELSDSKIVETRLKEELADSKILQARLKDQCTTFEKQLHLQELLETAIGSPEFNDPRLPFSNGSFNSTNTTSNPTSPNEKDDSDPKKL